MSQPILDILTDSEVHDILVNAVLQKNKQELTAADVNAKVVHRNIRQTDGSVMMVSSVAVLGLKETKPVPSSVVPSSDPKTSGSKKAS